jgi:hypothetical protein
MIVKFTRTIKQEVEATHLLAEMGVRYWEDASVNGVADTNENPTMPGVSGDAWVIKIDLETGKIEGWPKGTTASIHYKVCDAGVYKLLDADGKIVALKDGYVIDMMCPNGGGYGDYVIMEVDADGFIEDFQVDLECFENDDED